MITSAISGSDHTSTKEVESYSSLEVSSCLIVKELDDDQSIRLPIEMEDSATVCLSTDTCTCTL